MFRRRHPISFAQRLQGWLWPPMGWRRLGIYLVKRLTRLPGTPHSIAAGFACGLAISFTPFVGLHTVLSVVLSFLVRGNYLAGVVGTLFGNPWTFPFIWLASVQVGHFLLGGPPPSTEALQQPELHGLLHKLGDLIWPLTVGSVTLGVLAGLAVYFPVLRMVAAYQTARRHRRERRRAERRNKLDVASRGPTPDTSAS
jgi:uncharacterized protein (DUF2062 family)